MSWTRKLAELVADALALLFIAFLLSLFIFFPWWVVLLIYFVGWVVLVLNT